MALTDRQRDLYARQLLLAEIGEAGQERLLTAAVHIEESADPRAQSVARVSLERAGVCVARHGSLAVPCADTTTVERAAGAQLLAEAAALLCGSFAAVEALKALVGAGVASTFPDQLTLSSEDV